jgi:NTP pyrophosphatase (non-canonical NTP hydrolase)
VNLTALQQELRTFAAKRDWEQFHSIRNLVLALAGEVGELASEVQWRDGLTRDELHDDQKLLQAFSDELADILIYLSQLADVAGIDINKAVTEKLENNKRRYTVVSSKGNADKR